MAKTRKEGEKEGKKKGRKELREWREEKRKEGMENKPLKKCLVFFPASYLYFLDPDIRIDYC